MGNLGFQATGCWAGQVSASPGNSEQAILDFKLSQTRLGEAKRAILDFRLLAAGLGKSKQVA